jgi:hypothetical protein
MPTPNRQAKPPESCALCNNYVADDADTGVCRRFPPSPTGRFASRDPHPGETVATLRYPVVYAVEWCGGFVAVTA